MHTFTFFTVLKMPLTKARARRTFERGLCEKFGLGPGKPNADVSAIGDA